MPGCGDATLSSARCALAHLPESSSSATKEKRLSANDGDYSQPPIADTVTTTIPIGGEGTTRLTEIYASGMLEDPETTGQHVGLLMHDNCKFSPCFRPPIPNKPSGELNP